MSRSLNIAVRPPSPYGKRVGKAKQSRLSWYVGIGLESTLSILKSSLASLDSSSTFSIVKCPYSVSSSSLVIRLTQGFCALLSSLGSAFLPASLNAFLLFAHPSSSSNKEDKEKVSSSSNVFLHSCSCKSNSFLELNPVSWHIWHS